MVEKPGGTLGRVLGNQLEQGAKRKTREGRVGGEP